MVDKTTTDSEKPCCKNKTNEPKLVKATELPQHGNPYPPKDAFEDDTTMLEVKVRSLRTMLQPYISPLASVYDFMLIGVAHSQSALQRLAENQSSVVSALIITGSGLLGVGLARRRGIFKKLLYGSIFSGGALAACYPNDAQEKAQLVWYIAKNKLPVVAQQQYNKLVNRTSEESSSQKQTRENVEEK